LNKRWGLSEEDIPKISEALDAYKKAKKSDQFRAYMYKESGGELQHNWLSPRHLGRYLRSSPRHLGRYLRRISRKEGSYPSPYSNCDFRDKRYVLLLLNKRDNWRVDFFSPYFVNFPSLVRNIAISLPLTHSLLVKDHPHTANNKDLIDGVLVDECSRLSNVHYIDPKVDTFEVIEESEIVFSVASFSGFDSLFCLKHLVVFGNEPYFFGETDAPVIRMRNWDDLPEIIEFCLSTEPNIEDIVIYLFSFFKVTTARNNCEAGDDWTDFSLKIDHDEFFTKVSSFIGDYIDEYRLGAVDYQSRNDE
jgi:hypothetical protein